ncbi:MAG: type II toxin-antitoxin system VapC family toxin [Armatimonadetes bacterium]|nr:type II toxin-antitoxin system VapC family toxin [Armatimonadota bacterium]
MRLVLNASVVVKWLLIDEPLTAEALQVEQDFRDGQVEALLIPEFCLWEVANAIWVACRRGRIDEPTAKDLLQFLQSYIQQGILSVLQNPPLSDVLDFALRFGVPVYDSIYIVLAQREGCPLLTADERLFQAVADSLPFVQWLGDYKRQDPQ